MNIIDKLGITSEPWKLKYNNRINGRGGASVSNGKKNICGFVRGVDGNLIAAAPEMLEALIDHAYENRGWLNENSKIIMIIQKATGKTWEEIKELIE